jgi:hypothetical protein
MLNVTRTNTSVESPNAHVGVVMPTVNGVLDLDADRVRLPRLAVTVRENDSDLVGELDAVNDRVPVAVCESRVAVAVGLTVSLDVTLALCVELVVSVGVFVSLTLALIDAVALDVTVGVTVSVDVTLPETVEDTVLVNQAVSLPLIDELRLRVSDGLGESDAVYVGVAVRLPVVVVDTEPDAVAETLRVSETEVVNELVCVRLVVADDVSVDVKVPDMDADTVTESVLVPEGDTVNDVECV